MVLLMIIIYTIDIFNSYILLSQWLSVKRPDCSNITYYHRIILHCPSRLLDPRGCRWRSPSPPCSPPLLCRPWSPSRSALMLAVRANVLAIRLFNKAITVLSAILTCIPWVPSGSVLGPFWVRFGPGHSGVEDLDTTNTLYPQWSHAVICPKMLLMCSKFGAALLKIELIMQVNCI